MEISRRKASARQGRGRQCDAERGRQGEERVDRAFRGYPFDVAVPYSSPEVVKTLLDAGANVNAKDVRGMTPLMLAVSSEAQNPEVVSLLLKRERILP